MKPALAAVLALAATGLSSRNPRPSRYSDDQDPKLQPRELTADDRERLARAAVKRRMRAWRRERVLIRELRQRYPVGSRWVTRGGDIAVIDGHASLGLFPLEGYVNGSATIWTVNGRRSPDATEDHPLDLVGRDRREFTGADARLRIGDTVCKPFPAGVINHFSETEF